MHRHQLVQHLYKVLPGHLAALHPHGQPADVLRQEPESPPVQHLHGHQVDPPGRRDHRHADGAQEGLREDGGCLASGDGHDGLVKAGLPADADDEADLLDEEADNLSDALVVLVAVVELVQHPDPREAKYGQGEGQDDRQQGLVLPHHPAHRDHPPGPEEHAPGRGHGQACHPCIRHPGPVHPPLRRRLQLQGAVLFLPLAEEEFRAVGGDRAGGRN
mmetsp:Transcript_75383/g.201444  ORF Transcript_75383/g.201444 Transcript_75383/m.201444 type:complete len:217 (+) Transcript_75383:1700-2350(+)